MLLESSRESFWEKLTPIKLTFVYAIIGGLWIFVSDRLLVYFAGNTGNVTSLQTYKGWFFIVGTALLFYVLVKAVSRNKEQIKQQALLLDKTQEAIFVHTMDGNIQFWNKGAERMYGWSSKETLNKNAFNMLYKVASTQLHQREKALLEKGEWSGELYQVTREGKRIIVETRCTLLYDDRGNPHAVLSINTDVTEKKRLQAQLYRAQRLENIATLAGGIAHDLNNVLSPILMSIQMLKLSSNASQERIITAIEASVNRGAGIVKQIVAFTKEMENEQLLLQPRYIIQEVAKIIEATFPKTIRIDTDIPKDLPTIKADPTQLHQVLLNLCINARDAMPDGGALSISARNVTIEKIDEPVYPKNTKVQPGSYLLVEVADTGTGIPKEHLNKIFDSFFTTKEPDRGTGLGLSISLSIIQNHGGLVTVQSEEGKGTTFGIFFPALTDAAPAEMDEEATFSPGNGELILAIDDEASILDIIKQTLESFNYRVLVGVDSLNALTLAEQNRGKIVAVLIDSQMPLIDGKGTVKALKEIDPTLDFISISGSDIEVVKKEFRPLGVKYFLSKPFTTDQLMNTLQQVISKKKSADS